MSALPCEAFSRLTYTTRRCKSRDDLWLRLPRYAEVHWEIVPRFDVRDSPWPGESTPKREEPMQQTSGPKKPLTKSQVVGVMVVGGVMLVALWFIPSEQGSTLSYVKTGISLAGFIVLCFGS